VRQTSTGRRALLLVAALLLIAALSSAPSSALGALAARRPLPESDYSTRPVCGAPLPGQAACMAAKLVPETAAAKARSHPLGVTLPPGAEPTAGAASAVFGLRPDDLHEAYELPFNAPVAQTIAIVDAYDDPAAEADLRVFDEEFGLPECTEDNGCFRKINQDGGSAPLPQADGEWATEISLDVQTAHAVCQNCQILLVEADSSFDSDLAQAVDAAAAEGATEISNSYGGPEGGWESAYDHPGIVITASTGDWGYDNWDRPAYGAAANAPASLPTVVAVGGTTLSMSAGGWAGESAWFEAGSGCSIFQSAPAWQTALPNWAQTGCGTKRAAADVSADADPYSGVAIYNSYSGGGWQTIGGTSLSSPLIAATFALAGGAQGVDYPAQTLYQHLGGSGLHDVVDGTNALEASECVHPVICEAGPGYDGPTGVGTPEGPAAFEVDASWPTPTVTNVSPAAGPTSSGRPVTITGANLGEALEVRFGTARAAIVSDEEGSITVEAPGHEPGLVDVRVTGPHGTRSAATPADHYDYFVERPVVTAIEPSSGPTAGGTSVTIRGADLDEVEYVEFDGYDAPVVSGSPESVTVESPAHEAGTVGVTAVGPYGVSNDPSPAARYTYRAPADELLTIATAGTGHGRVYATPGSPCESICSEGFVEGSTVLLSAAPASGSAFAGWSGAGCSGTGTCEVTLWASATVTATFDATDTPGGGAPVTPITVWLGESHPGSTTGSSPPPVAETEPPEASEAHAFAGCVTAARGAFRHAKRAATHARGKARVRALAKANRRLRKQIARCRSHYPDR
jgi:hypothetical protein